MFIQRPNSKETEDDLLEQQIRFLNKSNNNKKCKSQHENQIVNETFEESKQFKDNHDIANIKFKIIEKNIVANPPVFNDTFRHNSDFPETFSLESIPKCNSSRKNTSKPGLSLYAQMKNKIKEDSQSNDNKMLENHDLITGTGLGGQNWQKDISEIKMNNQKMIENMSQDEIKAMRDDIMSKLSSKSIAFLTDKKFVRSAKKSLDTQCDVIKNGLYNMSLSDNKYKEIEDNIPIKANKYINMDIVESEKLKWIGDINESKQKEKKTDEISARFNFMGELIDNDILTEMDIKQGLHHHGEEQDRAGYTIDELFLYLQSEFPSQSEIGLRVFQKIINKAYCGYYDSCFNKNLIEYLLKDSNLILIVRLCIDKHIIWKTAISTLKALLCNTINDEIFLDFGYLILEDYLSYGYQIDLTLKPILDDEVEFDDEVTDQQYLAYDVIDCLLNRTSILQRFAYLIQNQLSDDDQPFIENIFDILIRFARHSKESCEIIIKYEYLMDAIISKMITKNDPPSSINMIHVKIFKLLRVCITTIKYECRNKQLPSSSIVTLLNIFSDVYLIESLNYCFLLAPEDVHHSTNEKIIPSITIEAIRLWLKLLSFCFENINHRFIQTLKNNFFDIAPYMLKILNYCKNLQPIEPSSNSNKLTFDFQFASYILMLIKMYHEILQSSDNLFNVYSVELYDITMKWLIKIQNNNLIPDFDCCLCLLILVEIILKHMKIDDRFIQLTMEHLMNNQGFVRKLIQLCMKNSNTNISKYEQSGMVRDSSNLPSYGSVYFKGYNSASLFRYDSPLCLLQCLIRVATITEHRKFSMDTFNQLFEYINLVTNSIKENFIPNIFDLVEMNIVADICLIMFKTINFKEQNLEMKKFSRSIVNFILLINVLNRNDIKNEIIENCLFDSDLHDTEQNFSITKSTYKLFSLFNNVYWIFDPLISQVNIDGKKPIVQKISLAELLSCLIFIEHLYDNFFKHHLLRFNINETLLFEILSTVFLIDENYFLDYPIHQILERLLKKLIHSGKIIITSRDNIPGLGNIVNMLVKMSMFFLIFKKLKLNLILFFYFHLDLLNLLNNISIHLIVILYSAIIYSSIFNQIVQTFF